MLAVAELKEPDPEKLWLCDEFEPVLFVEEEFPAL